MKPVKKSFDPKSLFSFELVYRDTKSPQMELPDHFHDWYEIVYVYSGKGTFFLDHSFYSMEQGDVFIIPGNTIHYAIPDKDDPVTSSALFFHPFLINSPFLGDTFSYLQIFEESQRTKNYKYSLGEGPLEKLETCIEWMHAEINQADTGYRHAVLLHLHMILLFLNRTMIQAHSKSGFHIHSGPAWIADLLDYIEENLMNRVSLSKLAARANVSTAHLSRVFKQMTGLNVTEYITTKKVFKSKELLLQTEDNVAVIAEKCGFDSMPHFHRMFKKYTGETPAGFRKKGEQM